MVPLRLQFGDDDNRYDDLVLAEPAERSGVRQQDTGIEYVRVVLPFG